MKNCRVPIKDMGKDGEYHVVKRTSHLKDGRKVKRVLTRRITDCKDYTKHFINIRKNDDGTLALDKVQKMKIDGVILPISEVVKIVTKYMEYIKHQKRVNNSNDQDQHQNNDDSDKANQTDNDQNNTGNSDGNNQNINEDPYNHPDNNLGS